jgi:DNA polymerase (family 10)
MKDLKSVLHLHTTFSDGANTLEQMAEAAHERGYAYLGVADHSQSARYAGGLSLREIEEQHAIADQLNRRRGGRFRIFKGIESDILADGALDYAPEVLERFDFVVASIHSRFRQLLRRPGYEVDVEAVLKACARHGVAVEINGNPYRLDLNWRWHRKAVQIGCLLSINPDAHSTKELDLVKWGVAVARKGGVSPEDVLNAKSVEQFDAYLQARRRRRSSRRRKFWVSNLGRRA